MTAVSSAPTTGRPEIDALIGGGRWADPTITYGFSSGPGDYGANYADNTSADARALGVAQQAAFRSALAEWSAVAGIAFIETAAASATIRVAVTSQADTAFAYYPSSGQEGGDVWLGTDVSARAATPGSYAYTTDVHELGHALGLRHPHQGANPGISDQVAYSVMSYRSYPGAPLTGYTIASGSYPTSPMISDIAAVQAIYGANYAFHAGADTYRWTPGATVFETVWDGGGTDTFDLSAFSTDLSVDLAPGGWTSFGTGLANLGNGQRPPGNVANALLFNNDARSLIENAIGGAGNDLIKGNFGANDLSGGVGHDTIFGAAGSDVLHGGAGNDVLYGGSSANDPADAADMIFGEAGDDLIYGNGGDDRLDAGQGSATVFGGYGADTIEAEMTAGAQVYLYGGSSANNPLDFADTLTLSGNGTNGFAQLLGNGGNDSLSVSLSGNARTEVYGGSGNDAIRFSVGDAGATSLIVGGIGADVLVMAVAGTATVYGGASANNPDDSGDWIDASGSTGRLAICGNGGNDTIMGSAGIDSIYGGAGDDVLSGGGCGDILCGGDGADLLRIGGFESLINAFDEIVEFATVDRLDLNIAGLGASFVQVQATATSMAQAVAASASAFAAGALYVAVRGSADTFLLADYDTDHFGEWGVKLTGFLGPLDTSTAIV